MRKDRASERILNRNIQGQAEMDRINKEWVVENRLTTLPLCNPLVRAILDDGVDNFLGHGSFSRVYAIDVERVLKFTRDLTSLKIMQKLCARSNYFPRVDALLEQQACDSEGTVYHAAIVERLEEGCPEWIRSVVDGYRLPDRADSPGLVHARLLKISYSIASGDIVAPPADVAPFSAAMRILAEECLAWRCLADLRTDLNFMMRADGQVVVADPAHPYGQI
jgi:hypothetical protein